MTTIVTSAPTNSTTDLDLVAAFARKTAQAGEEPIVRALWGTRYRINYYLRGENRIGRSILVTIADGVVEISKTQ